MYIFEKQSECHLSNDQLLKHKDSFYTIFEKSLADPDLNVRVASLRATASFLMSVDNEQVLAQFRALIPAMLETLVSALKATTHLSE